LTQGPDKSRWFLKRSHGWRRRVIQRPWTLPVAAMQLAAVILQRAWRSSWLSLTKPSSSHLPERHGRGVRLAAPAAPLPAVVEPRGQGSSDAAAVPERASAVVTGPAPAKRKAAFEALRTRYFGLLRRQCDVDALEGSAGGASNVVYGSFEHFCAAVIQGWWSSRLRLRMVRRVWAYGDMKLYHVASFEIQRAWRMFCQQNADRLLLSSDARRARKEQENQLQLALKLDKAARKMQRLFRGNMDYRVYESLKETVASFNRSGDPCLLLRQVAPRESMLLDPAMQVHVRFRLGGARWPPSIYYKIYTHGAIVDLCAFAPRNYAGERAVASAAIAAGTANVGEGGVLGGSRGKPLQAVVDGWYEREENNGWRPLAPRVCPGKERVQDEVELASARKPVKNFHYSRLRRRQDLERNRKQKTMDWMRKLYGLQYGEFDEEVEVQTARRQLQEVSAPSTRPSSGGARSSPGRGMSPIGGYAAGAPSAPSGAARLPGPAPPAPRPPPGPPPAVRPPRKSPWAGSASSGRQGRPSSASDVMSDISDMAIGPNGEVVRTTWAPAQHQRGGIGGSAGRYEEYEQDEEEDEELFDDDKLVEWSRTLNFDTYMQGWQRTATSDISEGTLPLASAPARPFPMYVH